MSQVSVPLVRDKSAVLNRWVNCLWFEWFSCLYDSRLKSFTSSQIVCHSVLAGGAMGWLSCARFTGPRGWHFLDVHIYRVFFAGWASIGLSVRFCLLVLGCVDFFSLGTSVIHFFLSVFVRASPFGFWDFCARRFLSPIGHLPQQGKVEVLRKSLDPTGVWTHDLWVKCDSAGDSTTTPPRLP